MRKENIMQTFTFLINKKVLVHVDLNSGYDYNVAENLICYIYPDHIIEYVSNPVFRDIYQRDPKEIKTKYAPYGTVCTVVSDSVGKYIRSYYDE